MRTIFVDESGYSGSNFIDDDKPLFKVASLGIEAIKAERMRPEFFSSVNAAEVKHSKLVGRPNQQRMVLDFLSAVAARGRSPFARPDVSGPQGHTSGAARANTTASRALPDHLASARERK